MCHCLEYQFDSVIKDRTMILQKMYLLSVVLKDQDIFTWEFFLNRFDSLCLEAQLDLESTGDIASLQGEGYTDIVNVCYILNILLRNIPNIYIEC